MELIDRAALKEVPMFNGKYDKEHANEHFIYGIESVMEYIEQMPTIDAVPVVRGRWIPVDEKNDAFDCSECDAMVQKRCNYCPNCGAKMDLEG